MRRTALLFCTLFVSSIPLTTHATWYSGGTWGTRTSNDTYLEVFGSAINEYDSGTAYVDLEYCDDAMRNWYNQMDAAGYTSYRYGTDGNAWSSEWEDATSDDTNADAADFAYFCGHGSSGSAYFNGTSGDNILSASETKWGEKDAIAIAFDSCQTLDSSGRTSFSTVNKNGGVHFIVGFQSDADDWYTNGDYYGYYLRMGYTISSAWRQSTRDSHATGTGAYVRFYSNACSTSSTTAVSTPSCDPTSGGKTTSSTWSL